MKNLLMQDMKQTIRFFFMLMALMMGATVDVWALSDTDIVINKIPADTKDETTGDITEVGGHVDVAVSGQVVTLTITPNTTNGYTINEKMITVEPMVDPSQAPSHRATIIANTITVTHTSGNDYTFTLPAQYSKANLTIRFYKPAAEGVTQIFSLSEISSTGTGNYELVCDVDASNYTTIASFSGTLTAQPKDDGSYPVIMNLGCPLFTTATNATISNLMLDKVSVSSGDNNGNVGAIACVAGGSTKIYNCGILSGSVSGGSIVGGLVGKIQSGDASKVRVVNCYNYADVSASGTGSYAAGIVGKNEGTVSSDGKTVGNVRIALCMMYGNVSGATNISPVYCGNHHNNQQKFTEYNYYLYSTENDADGKRIKKIVYTAYNDQMAIDKEEHLTRFPFYRHILNTHRELGAFFLFGASDSNDAKSITADQISEIGHWVLKKGINAPKYLVVEKWETNTKRTTKDGKENLPTTTENYAGKLLTEMGNNGYLKLKITINDKTYDDVELPITDMDTLRYDFTWGKVVLPFANEFSGWTEPASGSTNYGKICTGWKITKVSGSKNGTAFSYSASSITNYNFADRDNPQKDIHDTNNLYIFAQGGNYIVPYGVTDIEIEAHFANAFYLSDASYDIGYDTNYLNGQALGGSVSTSYNGKTVYTDLSTLVGKLSNTTNPHVQAIVLVGNYHFNMREMNVGDKSDEKGKTNLNTAKAVTIMSIDKDNNQEPDYGWYSYMSLARPAVPPLRFDFVPNISMYMSSHVTNTKYHPGLSIWKVRGWFELTETCVSIMSQCEIDSYNFADAESKGNNRWIANSGYFTQIVRSKDVGCTKLSYLQIGGNAYVKELYPGNHSDTNKTTNLVPILVTGGEVEQCFMTGYGKGKAYGTDIYFWCAGGKIDKFLGAYMEPVYQTNNTLGNVNLTAQIDHARIGRFFGGGTSPSAKITGNIRVTINNSLVDFYCGGPEFGDMVTGTNGKEVITNATGTTFGEYYGAGFGGTSITYTLMKDEYNVNISNNATTSCPDYFTKYYKNGDAGDKSVGSHKRLTACSKGIATSYKYEFIMNSIGKYGVGRFYSGCAQFSLATTGNVTNNLTNCIINGDFYGAGCQGKVDGTVTSTLKDCTINGNAFGGGFKAVSNELKVYGETTGPSRSVFTKETSIFSGFGTVEPEIWQWTQGNSTNKNTKVDGENKIYTDVTMSDLGNVEKAITLNIDGGSVGGNVFGGGNESKSKSNATVNIKDGTIIHDVYGGGNVADVNGNTKVSLIGGTVNGDVYGGGKGRLEKGVSTDPDYVSPIAATVGSTKVNLNGIDAADYKADYTTLEQDGEGDDAPYVVKDSEMGCIVKGSIFGCNNLNGTPKGDVTVHIYKTQNAAASRITNPAEGEKTAKVAGRYDIKAVYGGGNLAPYEPNATKTTGTDDEKEASKPAATVIIDGCDRSSIGQVYGGGNAASTPATSVTVNGTYEIGELFGGGNGKDDISKDGGVTWIKNPGANVGFKDYSEHEKDEGFRTKEERQNTNNTAFKPYIYGSGKASVNIKGGMIHQVFGGSNTKGNVRIAAVTMLEEVKNDSNEPICPFHVDEAYGGGKSAPMDAEAKLLMACIPGLEAAYGGAEAADIHGNVELNITNGNFDRVFGGNNKSGTINGSITINIEETGCKPIIIGELYGGGNLAGYSKYGYKLDEEGETMIPIEDPDDPEALKDDDIYDDPEVNVKSFTSIGDIYGGGYGETAVMVGNPTVNINVGMGDKTNYTDESTYKVGETDVPYYDVNGFKELTKTIDGHTVIIPQHKKGMIGAVNNVFGGGNAAKVIGNTNVNIGTLAEVYLVKEVTTGSSVAGLYIRNNNGSYSGATGTAVDGTTYYEKKDVEGVDIRGNVYGGGNNAEVTGNTNVTIGKQAE